MDVTITSGSMAGNVAAVTVTVDDMGTVTGAYALCSGAGCPAGKIAADVDGEYVTVQIVGDSGAHETVTRNGTEEKGTIAFGGSGTSNGQVNAGTSVSGSASVLTAEGNGALTIKNDLTLEAKKTTENTNNGSTQITTTRSAPNPIVIRIHVLTVKPPPQSAPEPARFKGVINVTTGQRYPQ